MSGPAVALEPDVAVRLEVLKLVNRFDLAPQQIIERAAAFEQFVQQGAPIKGRKADKGQAPAT